MFWHISRPFISTTCPENYWYCNKASIMSFIKNGSPWWQGLLICATLFSVFVPLIYRNSSNAEDRFVLKFLSILAYRSSLCITCVLCIPIIWDYLLDVNGTPFWADKSRKALVQRYEHFLILGTLLPTLCQYFVLSFG